MCRNLNKAPFLKKADFCKFHRTSAKAVSVSLHECSRADNTSRRTTNEVNMQLLYKHENSF